MNSSEDLFNQLILNFLNSPFGVLFIFGIVLNIAMVVAFFVTAYNVSKIRADLNEWLELEHPTIEDDTPRKSKLK